MKFQYILIAVFIFIGSMFLLNIRISMSGFKKEEQRGKKKRKLGKVSEFQERVSLMLTTTNSKLTLANYFAVSALLFLLGIFSGGLLYGNILLGVVLALGLPFTQYQLLLKKRSDMIRSHNEKLEIYMSMVTNSYMQSGDIESAISDTYSRMDTKEAAARPFELFIGQSAGDSDIKRCILDMKLATDNEHFRQWCDKLAICHENSSLRHHVLPYVVNRMRRKRTRDSEMVTESHSNYKEYLAVLSLCMFLSLVIPMAQPTWRYIITQTTPGNISIAFTLAVYLLSTAYVVKVNKPGGNKT